LTKSFRIFILASEISYYKQYFNHKSKNFFKKENIY
jgi:hypothetical protein